MEHPDVFVEEPPKGSIDWTPRLAAVKSRPGKWHRIGRWPASSSASGHRVRLRKALGQEWEFAAGKLAEGGSALYARYLGAPEETP